MTELILILFAIVFELKIILLLLTIRGVQGQIVVVRMVRGVFSVFYYMYVYVDVIHFTFLEVGRARTLSLDPSPPPLFLILGPCIYLKQILFYNVKSRLKYKFELDHFFFYVIVLDSISCRKYTYWMKITVKRSKILPFILLLLNL